MLQLELWTINHEIMTSSNSKRCSKVRRAFAEKFWLGRRRRLWAKKRLLGIKNNVSWARSALLHDIYCICIFAITRKKDAFVAKMKNKNLTKNFEAIFALAERLPTSATLSSIKDIYSTWNSKSWTSRWKKKNPAVTNDHYNSILPRTDLMTPAATQ